MLGMTMRLRADSADPASDRHVDDARTVAGKLGIPHCVIDLRETFTEYVAAPFVHSYLSGETPSPCVRCNRHIKFGALARAAREAGCEAMATGHYVRRVEDDRGRILLKRAADKSKDQSYFLFELTQDQLRFARFPVGEMTKREVKATAAALGLVPRERPESQDLCFIPDGDYAGFLRSHCPGIDRPGKILSLDGRELGSHEGFYKYTIGQRKGLGLSDGPWYVCRLNAATNTVVVGRQKDVEAEHLTVQDLNWLMLPPDRGAKLERKVQVRFAMRPVSATIEVGVKGRAEVDLCTPVSAITPGQAAVFYDADCVVGGGWIAGGAAE